nr:hypothetical protein CFP56_04083 [Quercus suber]
MQEWGKPPDDLMPPSCQAIGSARSALSLWPPDCMGMWTVAPALRSSVHRGSAGSRKACSRSDLGAGK